MSTRILLLDDDQKMFRAINRLVRPLDVALLTASTPERGLEFCRDYDIQVVIADLNRSDMDVIAFFSGVRAINPLTRKIVLTSFAELDSTVAAINSGKINRYFTKPWDANELRSAIVEELNEYLDEEKKKAQISELGEINEEVEEKADFTAKLLDGTVEMLAGIRYRTAISIFLPLLERRLPGSENFAKRTAKTASLLSDYLGLSTKEREEISIAAELHEIGLLSLPDAIIEKRYESMSDKERALFEQYPELSADVLQEESQADAIVTIIRHHREDNDGGGYPYQLAGIFIPVGSRILRVAADYEELLEEYGRDDAIAEMLNAGSRIYDPIILQALTQIKGSQTSPALYQSGAIQSDNNLEMR